MLKFCPPLAALERPYPLGVPKDSRVPMGGGASILTGGELMDMMSPLSV